MDKINATPVRLANLHHHDPSAKRTVSKSAHGDVQDILVALGRLRVRLRRVCDPLSSSRRRGPLAARSVQSRPLTRVIRALVVVVATLSSPAAVAQAEAEPEVAP